MKKAAIYNQYLDTLGGGERYTMAFAKALSKNGYKVDVEWANDSIRSDIEKKFGIELTDVNFIPSVGRGDTYDLCFWVSDGSIPTLRARNNILHFQMPFTNVNGRTLLNKMKFYRINHVVCNSNFTKSVIDKEFGINSSVLHPPVDTISFKPKRKSNSIIYVGRFSKAPVTKSQDVLIRLFEEFNTKVPNSWELIIAGGSEVGGEEFVKELKKMSKGLPIKILENVSFPEIKRIVGEAKFFWSAAGYDIDEMREPIKVEHFGISLVEAMSAGCVPVVINKGGYKEIIQDGTNGILWNSKDSAIKSTLALVSDYKKWKAMSDSAKKDSIKYSYDNFEKEALRLL